MLVEKEQGGGWGQSCAKAIVGPRHIQIFEKSIYPNRFNFDLGIFLFAQVYQLRANRSLSLGQGMQVA